MCAARSKHGKLALMMAVVSCLPFRLAALGLMFSLVIMGSVLAGQANQAEGFAQLFVDAINSKSPDRRLALLHPRSKACINAQTQAYFDYIFSRQAKHVIPAAKYKSFVGGLSGEAVVAADGRSDYPLRPTHQLQIDFATGSNSSTSIVVLLVQDGASWYEVLPCPRPDAIASVRAAEANRADHEQRVKSLVAKLADPLRSEIVALARKGQRIDAIRKYRDISGEDLSTAKSVVDTLAPLEPSAK